MQRPDMQRVQLHNCVVVLRACELQGCLSFPLIFRV
jgi:hypothetical protein